MDAAPKAASKVGMEAAARRKRALATKARINQVALVISIPLFLVVWQLVSVSEVVNRILFPPPTEVAVALYHSARDGTLLIDVLMSASRVIVGYCTGAFAGIAIGLLTGRYALVSNLLTPIFQLL